MSKLRCTCQYCGNDWEVPAYLAKKPVCLKCKETKAIKVRKDQGKSNVFGYDEEEKPQVTYDYED